MLKFYQEDVCQQPFCGINSQTWKILSKHLTSVQLSTQASVVAYKQTDNIFHFSQCLGLQLSEEIISKARIAT